MNLCRALSEQGDYHVHVVTRVALSGEVEIEIPNVSIHRIKSHKTKLIRFVSNQRRVAKFASELAESENASLILQETMTDMLIPFFLPDQHRNRHAVRIHGCYETERRYFYPGMTNFISRNLSSFISKRFVRNFVSTNRYHIDFVKRHFLSADYYKELHKEFFILPNTIESQKILSEDLEKRSGKPIKAFTLGRMDHSGFHQKGFQDLLMALGALQSGGYDRDIQLEVVGDGPFRKKLIELKNELGLENVEFTAQLPHEKVLRRLQDCDVVVLPSRYEGMSMFALEAIASGKAVIFSKNTGLADMCIDEVNGRTFDARDVQALSNCLLEITTSREKLMQMGAASRELYEREYSPGKVEKGLRNILSAVDSMNAN